MTKKSQQIGLFIAKEQYNVPQISKASVLGTAENIYNSVLHGDVEPSVVAEFFKFSSEVEKQIESLSDEKGKNSFKELVIEDITRNSEDGKSYNSRYGTKFSLMEAGWKYDYSKCNDPIWDNLKSQVVSLTESLKAREALLKTIKGSMLISFPNPETGELIENHEIYPPAVSSTTTYKTELLKD
jgi:hypothetical protein